jgi:hypothetical protein
MLRAKRLSDGASIPGTNRKPLTQLEFAEASWKFVAADVGRLEWAHVGVHLILLQ